VTCTARITGVQLTLLAFRVPFVFPKPQSIDLVKTPARISITCVPLKENKHRNFSHTNPQNGTIPSRSCVRIPDCDAPTKKNKSFFLSTIVNDNMTKPGTNLIVVHKEFFMTMEDPKFHPLNPVNLE
jgi:hypothetical protein